MPPSRLIETLRRRYNFVVVDAPFTGMMLHRDLLMLGTSASWCMEPTLVGGSRCTPTAGAAEWAAAGAPRPAGPQPSEAARSAHTSAGRGRAEDEGRHHDPRSAEAAWAMPRASANPPLNARFYKASRAGRQRRPAFPVEARPSGTAASTSADGGDPWPFGQIRTTFGLVRTLQSGSDAGRQKLHGCCRQGG